MPKTGLPLKTLIIIIVLVIAIPATIYWLWQRQPKGMTLTQELLTPASQNQGATGSAVQAVKVTIEDGKVLQQKKLQLQGQVPPNSLVVIYSAAANAIVKSDPAGSFTNNIDLVGGLNLISISVLGPDYKEIAAKNLTYYQDSTNTTDSIVYAGLVKSIFENIITLTTQSGEMPIKKSNSTQVNIPKLPGVETQPQDQDVRVGDYMIALGKTVTKGQMEAKSINILRDNKPQNQTRFAVVRILSNPSKNTFSAQQNGQSSIVKIATTKDTSYFDQNNEVDIKAVAKDKLAIVIFHEDAKANDVANLVYLLP